MHDVLMMRRLVFLFLLIFFTPLSVAYAYECVADLNNEKNLQDAYFVGLVKVDAVAIRPENPEPGSDDGPLIIMSPLASYKGHIEPESVVHLIGYSCLPEVFQAGQTREVMLGKGSVLFVQRATQKLSDETWKNFREEHRALAFLSCKNPGEKVVFPYGGIVECKKETGN